MMYTRKKKSNGAARSQALAWYVERLDAELSPEDEAGFNAWLAADPAHEREYSQLDTLCEQLGAFEAAPQVEQAKAYAARYRAQAARAGAFARFGVAGSWQALAAASAVLLVAGWLAINSGFFSLSDGHYQTALGEQFTVELADGSMVRLNTDSSLDVAYSEYERRVLLHQGQASFDVASDPMRPFVVEAGEGIVTAVGTTFDVYNNAGVVTVTLIEGIVQVRRRGAALDEPTPPAQLAPNLSPPADDAGAEIALPVAPPVAPLVTSMALAVAELHPGEQVSFAPGGGLTPVAQVDVVRVMAWEDGMIDLQNMPLRDAIHEVNRYSEIKLVLLGAELDDASISGIFRVGKPENFVRALETRFGLRASRTAGDRILLRPPPLALENPA